MNMSRRSFMGSMLALAAAPAIVRADSLMRVIPINTTILTEAHIEAALTEISKITGLSANKLLWPGVKHWWGKSFHPTTPAFDILIAKEYQNALR